MSRKDSELLTVGEASRILCIHPNTLRRWSESKAVPCYRLGPRSD